MKVEACAHPRFARHESFHPRYGWFKKGIDGASSDPALFARESAVVDLGVGKNMVRAIRFWGIAAKLLTTVPNPDRPRQPLLVPTHLGRAIFHDDGWDPYSEDPGTLWLLHWLLLAPKSSVPVWWIALNEFPGLEFSADELHDFVVDFTNGIGDWDDVQPSSIRKDVDCFIRMYTAANNQARITGDDAVDCPFKELGILRAGVTATAIPICARREAWTSTAYRALRSARLHCTHRAARSNGDALPARKRARQPRTGVSHL